MLSRALPTPGPQMNLDIRVAAMSLSTWACQPGPLSLGGLGVVFGGFSAQRTGKIWRLLIEFIYFIV